MPNSEKTNKEENTKLPPTTLLPPVKLVGSVYVDRKTFLTGKKNLKKVIPTSLLTNAYGHLLMLLGIIQFTTFSAFLLVNLCFAAPVIAITAGLVKYLHLTYKGRNKGTSRNKASAITAIKFFIIYMVAMLGIALATTWDVLSGSMLPLGILLVVSFTTLGVILASFLKGTLKIGFLQTLFGASLLTLLNSLHASSMGLEVATGIGAVPLVGLTVSATFLLGFFARASYSKLAIHLKPKKIINASQLEKKLNALLLKETKIKEAFIELKKEITDPRLKNLIEEYIKYKILLECLRPKIAISKAQKEILTQKRTCLLFPVFLCKQTQSLTMLEKAKNLTDTLNHKELSKKNRDNMSYELKKIREKAVAREAKSQTGLQKWGIFETPQNAKIQESSSRRAPSIPIHAAAA